MIGYILTEEQYLQLQGTFYAPYEFFNCLADIDGDWFLILSEQDKEQITNTEWNWILSLPYAEYIPKPSTFPI
jgi:hypothetical protein